MAADPRPGPPAPAGGPGLRPPDALRELARLHGVQLSYVDADDRRRRASPEALVAVLRALGAPLEGVDGAPRALEARRDELDRRAIEPVVVAWDGEPTAVPARLPGRVRCHLDVEGDGSRRWTSEGDIRLPALPLGYHALTCSPGSGADVRCLVVAAPRRAPGLPGRGWGVFAPLNGLRSERSLGIGDLTDLEALLGWVAELGGGLVATLPLLASFTDEPFEPSPYTPASRLFWNELYVDPRRAAELEGSPEARELLASRGFRDEATRLADADLVDLRAVAKLRRGVLEALARAFFTSAGDARRDDLRRLLAERPSLEGYAVFRARGGPDGEADYHRYAQLLAHEQMAGLAVRAAEAGSGLYLDLPLGVHPDGFDVLRHPEAFASDVSGGAPPDTFFAGGQAWGFRPLHPERIREDGYAYLRACLRHLLRHARVLRVDHVMGLHRLFWVPVGMEATDGVYVRYRPDEWYAILALEAHRHDAVVVGEDLGTVPATVRHAMRRHGLHRSHVLQLEASAEGAVLPDPPADAFASHNTHDLPPFAAWWATDDIALRERHDAIRPDEAEAERSRRSRLREALVSELVARGRLPDAAAGDDERRVFDATLDHLASSSARVVVVNLEDLWGERRQQNVPGTTDEHPNWRGRLAYTLEELRDREEAAGRLGRVDAQRRGSAMARDRRKAETLEPVSHDVSTLTDDDLHLFNEGTHTHLHHKLGAHVLEHGGTTGTHFAVWAPAAERITVFGDFNGWDKGSHELRPRGGSGIWEGFVPGVGKGTLYKYHVRSRIDGYTVDKTDPFAALHEIPPKTASIVWPLAYEWGDADWLASRRERNDLGAPISIYEMHLGSWMHAAEGESLSYRALAPRLADHLERMNFTHVEFLPVMEHPFYGSWGYQSTGFFAPTSRFGTPEDFASLVDHLHQRGLGVICDWVPSHFQTDEFALGFFDGTHLYEHADPRKGIHPDWKSYIFNYARNEVRSFLISAAIHWLSTYHTDGLRVDAVASMLYLDYSREEGEWIPNEYGGRENLEAIDFLRQLNESVYREEPDVQTIAEESTSWPSVSRPTYVGGLGFGMKWDMGWMHDTLEYFRHDPVHRKYHHNNLTFRMVYAFHENFCLPLSHDEVVHEKGSLLGKMPGDDWGKFANLRALYGYMWTSPAKKLLFMGGELGQWREWDHDRQLDWHLLEHAPHEGIRRWVADLNRAYRDEPALHELDTDPAGFEWVDANDSEGSTLSFLRRGKDGETILCCFNFTPIPRHSFRVGVPGGAYWRELLNSDAEHYGGSGQGNLGGVESLPIPLHSRPRSLTITLPPMGCVLFKAEEPPPASGNESSG